MTGRATTIVHPARRAQAQPMARVVPMASRSQLTSSELAEALAAAAAVVGDHAIALDRLTAVHQWGDGDEWSDGEGAAEEHEVADGPGRCLARTLDGAAVSTGGAAGMSGVCAAMERGARGVPAPSDVVEFLAGLAEALRNADHLDAERVAIGLEIAAERLADGDDGAHAGCLPAVVAAAAAGALESLDTGADLGEVLIAAADEGLVELESGPLNNPELAELGVVDATAAGFLLVLDVFASFVTGEPMPEPPSVGPAASSDGRRYEVRCRIRPHDGCGIESANWLESTWYELGELVEFDGIGVPWRAGLVTASPGAAVEAIFEVGRPHDLHIGLATSAT